MFRGEAGVVGPNVPRPVLEAWLRGQENATVVGINVRVMLERPENVM